MYGLFLLCGVRWRNCLVLHYTEATKKIVSTEIVGIKFALRREEVWAQGIIVDRLAFVTLQPPKKAAKELFKA